MGFESRDYARDGSYTASLSAWGMDLTPVVKYLVIANVVVFLLQVLLARPVVPEFPNFDLVAPDGEEIVEDTEAHDREKLDDAEPPVRNKVAASPEERRKREAHARKVRRAMEEMMARAPGMQTSVIQQWFELDPKKTVEQGQVWRLLTSAFCHDRYGLWHILFNMLLLCWFGQRLERMYGSREFLLFYLTAAVSASLAYVALAYYNGSQLPAIGASGAVMAVMMLYVIFYPFEQFLLFWFIPMPLWAMLGLYMLYDLHPVLLSLAGDRMFTGVAHASHLGGLAFGFLYWRFGWRLEPILDRMAPADHRSKSRGFTKSMILPYAPRDHELAERVDEVLKKISEEGASSLTDEERELLNRASAKYRGEK
jgi:membrane associated rhomboid family serine protease